VARHSKTSAWALAATLCASAQGADPWRGERTLVFGEGRLGWLAVSLPELTARPLRVPGFDPDGVALAPDGKSLVLTALDPSHEFSSVYRWSVGQTEPPTRIGDTRGYAVDPVVSADGQWAYFAHSPFKRGRPGAHSGMAYLELYRVHLDGSGFEQLTSSAGCHVQPLAALERLFFVHVNCGHRGQHLEEWGGANDERRTLPGEMSAEPDVSPDGKRVLVAASHLHGLMWERWRLGLSPVKEAERSVEKPALHLRPRFGRSATELLYQSERGVVLETDGATTLLSEFPGGGS
jgi:hypothetical protein